MFVNIDTQFFPLRILELLMILTRCQDLLANLQIENSSLKTFVGGVVEHIPYSVENVVSKNDGLDVKMHNLNRLEYSIRRAVNQEVEMIVFPEYGITGYMGYNNSAKLKGREAIEPYREKIPPAGSCPSVTCSLSAYARLSCLAKKYKMYITANLIEEVACNSSDCPPDGVYQYNTNLVFNKTGCLIAKYHKFHLFEREQENLDAPITPEHVVFDTELGRFGTMVCYDIMFEKPGIALVEEYHVDHIVYTTDWMNRKAFLYTNIVQVSTGWARRMKVNFLAANNHDLPSNTYGSAISTSRSILNATYEDVNVASDILLTSKLGAPQPTVDQEAKIKYPDVNLMSRQSFEGEAPPTNFTMIRGPSGSAQSCSGNFCCLVEFERTKTDEMFVVAAVNGDIGLGFLVQACLVQKCARRTIESCEERDNSKSSTHFNRLQLSGFFKSNYVLPSVMASGYRFSGLDWCFHHKDNINVISFDKLGYPILSVSLLGVI